VLIRALPHLPADLREQTRAYIRTEFEAYPLHRFAHIGWRDGAPREIFDLPPEAMAKLAAFGPQTSADPRRGYTRWAFPPQGNYALYRYVQAKAMILKEPYEELVKYLDVPAFWRGDLYYIDNLCAALESRP